MRSIGHLPDKSQARVFSEFLYAHGIKSQVDEMPDGTQQVWILDDDRVAEGSALLADFIANPADARFGIEANEGKALRKRDQKKAEDEKPLIIDARTTFFQIHSVPFQFLTLGLCVFSIGLFVFERVGSVSDAFAPFMISEVRSGFLTEVMAGQVWRLVTPILLHFSILHIIFNMMWLKDLGNIVEYYHGTIKFAALIAISAIVSNLAQYVMKGPNFGGMSGINYALFGFVWLRGRFDPASPYRLDGVTIATMMVFMVICFTGWIGPIANWVHLVGFCTGAAAGFVSSGYLKRKFR